VLETDSQDAIKVAMIENQKPIDAIRAWSSQFWRSMCEFALICSALCLQRIARGDRSA